MKKAFFLLGLPMAFLFSCNNETPDPTPTPTTIGMIVVNEGNWGDSSSSLTAITSEGTVVANAFERANNRPLGDAAQSIAYIDGNYYVAVNASGKIEVVEPGTLKSVKTILFSETSPLDLSPLFAVGIGNGQAIVATHEALLRINTSDHSVIEEIPVTALGGRPDRMVVAGGKLFCAVWKPDLDWSGADTRVGLAVFDLTNIVDGQGRLMTDVPIGDNAKTCNLILDKNGKVWAVSHDVGVSLTLNRIDPATETVEERVVVTFAQPNAGNVGQITGAPFYPRLESDQARSKLYVTLNRLAAYNDGTGTEELAIYTLDVDQARLSDDPFCVASEVLNFYGMGVSPDGNTVYVCDAISWLGERGELWPYSAQGAKETDRKEVGIFPSMVYFTAYDQ